MPRRLRIEAIGYHHVYNRGVAKNNVFEDDADKAKFIELMAMVSREFKFNLHGFCLMDNHYHLLVETKRENLSSGMRQLNAQYASYFNKRHNRVGHLWQDRFKSWYVLDKKLLLDLFCYIENNPIKAQKDQNIGEYRYSAAYSILQDAMPSFLQNTFVLRDYSAEILQMHLKNPFTLIQKERIEAFHHTRYKKQTDGSTTSLYTKNLLEYFGKNFSKIQRNEAIKKAHEEGYTKSDIARHLGLSVAGISRILKH